MNKDWDDNLTIFNMYQGLQRKVAVKTHQNILHSYIGTYRMPPCKASATDILDKVIIR